GRRCTSRPARTAAAQVAAPRAVSAASSGTSKTAKVAGPSPTAGGGAVTRARLRPASGSGPAASPGSSAGGRTPSPARCTASTTAGRRSGPATATTPCASSRCTPRRALAPQRASVMPSPARASPVSGAVPSSPASRGSGWEVCSSTSGPRGWTSPGVRSPGQRRVRAAGWAAASTAYGPAAASVRPSTRTAPSGTAGRPPPSTTRSAVWSVSTARSARGEELQLRVRRAALDGGGGDVRRHPVVGRVVRRVVVHDEVLVRRRPLRRDAPRPADQVDDLQPVGAVLRAGGGDHVRLQHARAEVVRAVVQGQLADLLAGGQPGALDVGDVVEEQAGDGDHPQVLEQRGLGAALQVVVLRLVGVRNEGAEAAGAVLHVPDHAQVLDAF